MRGRSIGCLAWSSFKERRLSYNQHRCERPPSSSSRRVRASESESRVISRSGMRCAWKIPKRMRIIIMMISSLCFLYFLHLPSPTSRDPTHIITAPFSSLYTIHRCNLIFIVNNIRKTCSFFHYFILNLKKLKLPF